MNEKMRCTIALLELFAICLLFAIALPSVLQVPCLAVDKASPEAAGLHMASLKPFMIIYKIKEPNGAESKKYIWSDGRGRFRFENELPYSTIDGITDVVFEDYEKHKRYIVNTNFQTVEVYPLGKLNIPVTDHELSTQLGARTIGTRKIAGYTCKGWRYGNNEVWIAPELGWYLEFNARSPQGTLVCSAEKVEFKPQPAERFALPLKYKFITGSEDSAGAHHRH